MQRILTSVDETIVVLLESLGAVTPASEVDRSDALRNAPAVVVQSHVTEGANSSREKLLKRKVRK